MSQKLKLITAFLCGAVFFSGVSYAASGDIIAKVSNFKIKVNGVEKKFQNKPVVINDRAYLPIHDVADLVGYNIDFKDNVISLDSVSSQGTSAGSNSTGETSTSDKITKHNFQKLPITATKNDVSVTINSVTINDETTDFNITIGNNTSDQIYLNFNDGIGYNYSVTGKEYKTSGTVNTTGLPRILAKGKTETGTISKGKIDSDAENVLFYVVINDSDDFAFTFPIQLK